MTDLREALDRVADALNDLDQLTEEDKYPTLHRDWMLVMGAALDAYVSASTPNPAPGPFIAYFTQQGEGWIVTDRVRPSQTRIATVSTDPSDYGRANTLMIADALNRAARASASTTDLIEAAKAAASYLEDMTSGTRPYAESIARRLRAAILTRASDG